MHLATQQSGSRACPGPRIPPAKTPKARFSRAFGFACRYGRGGRMVEGEELASNILWNFRLSKWIETRTAETVFCWSSRSLPETAPISERLRRDRVPPLALGERACAGHTPP